MVKTAIIYVSSLGGHVSKTAEIIASALDADTFDLKKQSDIDLGGYEKLILGVGVHAGRPYGKMTAFVAGHRDYIDTISTSLYICCMYKDDKGSAQAAKIADMYRIHDVSFFPDSSEKDENGQCKELRAFIERMRK